MMGKQKKIQGFSDEKTRLSVENATLHRRVKWLTAALRDTIQRLEKTRTIFKSKSIAAIREDLELALENDELIARGEPPKLPQERNY